MRNPFDVLGEYELRHLPRHLADAGNLSGLHRVLTCTTSDDANAWYVAKDLKMGTAAYIADLRLAWGACGDEPESVGKRCQYAASICSVNSMAAKLAPELVLALVKCGLWTTERATTYARHVPEVAQRCKTLVLLNEVVDPQQSVDLCSEAVSATKAIQSSYDRGECYSSILKAWHENPPRFLLEAILDNARSALTRYDQEHARHPLIRAAELSIPFLEHAISTYRVWGETLPITLLRLAMKSSQPMFQNDVRATVAKWRRQGPAGLARLAVILEGSISDVEHAKLVAEALQAVARDRKDSVARPAGLLSLRPPFKSLAAWRWPSRLLIDQSR